MAHTDSITDELIARYTELTGGAFSAAATPRGVLLPLVVTFAAQGRQFQSRRVKHLCGRFWCG